MLTEKVLPILQAKYTLPILAHKYYLTAAIPESTLAEKIADWEDALPEHTRLAYLPSLGTVKLRLSAYGDDKDALETELAQLLLPLQNLLADNLYATELLTLEERIGQLLLAKNAKLSVTESFTGGAIAARITAIAGASNWFAGSITAYSADAKIALLGVDKSVVETNTVYSLEVAKAMAEGVKNKFNTEYAIATTGVAGPNNDGDTPVGTVYLAVATPDSTVAFKHILQTERQTNIALGSTLALFHLWQALK
jgi:nicotinamide-nucleotide amidase